jgi:phosphoenolpyruvate synthase/pyruvate phosphate dikinase
MVFKPKILLTNIMTQATDTDIKELKDLITGLREEVRVGFTKLEGKIEMVEAKLEGKIDTAEAKLEGKIDKLDERTKLGFWGFIFRGTALAALAALTAIFVKYLFPILPALPNP